jgi:MMP 1-O-methyltransferase
MNSRASAVAVEAKGWLSSEEGMALYRLASEAVGPVVEIGSYCGKSTVYLAAGAAENGTLVVAVDHHRGNPEMRFGSDCHDPDVIDPFLDAHDTLLHLRRTIRQAGLEEHVMIVAAPSEVAAGYWSNPIGMLFIDGDHSYDGCHRDYAAWAPNIAGGGMLVFHDATIPDIGRVTTEAAADGFVMVDDVGCMRIMRRP